MNDSQDGSGNGLDLAGLLTKLSSSAVAATDGERIDRIRQFEELKSVIAAAQARESVAFAASQRAEHLARSEQAGKAGQLSATARAERAERGIAEQIALARRCSPYHARRYLGWVRILTSELPHTFAALQAGKTTEWRAMLVARETIWLCREHRAIVDRELASRLEGLGDLGTERAAKKLAYRLDPAGAVERLRNAENERRVGLRAAPDVMGYLSALLPLAQAVAVHTALYREADSLLAAGDPRSRGQIMADTLVQRLTGQAHAGDVPIEINLIITDQTLFGTDETEADCAEPEREATDFHAPRGAETETSEPETSEPETSGAEAARGPNEPAYLHGHGPVPAPWARQLILGSDAPVWLRRLYTAPHTGQLISMDSRRRCFTPTQRHFIQLRDQTCRTPWCDAPIRHIDHIKPAEHGGPTSIPNGQGYCQACNHAKQAPGWTTTVTRTGPHTVEITTPTGHRYQSRAPDPPGRDSDMSPVEIRLRQLLQAA